MWTENLTTLFCLTKRWQIKIIYRFTWKYISCLCCVCLKLADCFLSSSSLNICLSSLLSSVKRRHILCTGEHGKWNIKCIVFYSHECLCEILHLISTVVCQMSTLYCGRGGGSRNISCMPRWRFNMSNVQLHKYIYHWSLEIFKSTFLLIYIFLVLRHISLFVASLVVARNWLLAWAWWNIWYYIIIFRYRTLHKHAYILQIMSVSATDYLEDDTLGRGINQLKVMKT